MVDIRLDDVEGLAKVIFDSSGFYRDDTRKPAWVERGNAFRQDDARDIARAIIARYGAPPVAAPVEPAKPTQSIQVVARPLSEWHEDMGDVLWWKFPVEEAPWVGTPLCVGRTMRLRICCGREDNEIEFASNEPGGGWPGYHTHFTPLPPMPAEPIVAPDPAVEAGLATLPKDYLPSDRDIETAIRAALAVERRK